MFIAFTLKGIQEVILSAATLQIAGVCAYHLAPFTFRELPVIHPHLVALAKLAVVNVGCIACLFRFSFCRFGTASVVLGELGPETLVASRYIGKGLQPCIKEPEASWALFRYEGC